MLEAVYAYKVDALRILSTVSCFGDSIPSLKVWPRKETVDSPISHFDGRNVSLA